jgi:hypothetical protein
MGGACKMHRRNEKDRKNLHRKSLRKRSLGIAKRRYENNIEMYLRGTENVS